MKCQKESFEVLSPFPPMNPECAGPRKEVGDRGYRGKDPFIEGYIWKLKAIYQ